MLLYSTSGFGVFNYLIGNLDKWAVGLGFWTDQAINTPIPFTRSGHLVWAVIPLMVWTATGFYMLLFQAAMQSIPQSLYESALIDGAGSVSKHFHITLPLIRDTLVTGVVFLMITGLKVFDPVWILEQQQSRPESNTLATLLYAKIFNDYQIGFGTAIAVVQFLLVFLFTVTVFRFYRQDKLEY
jgi:N-acetylglucosamine transport system permease protein